MIIMGIFLFIL